MTKEQKNEKLKYNQVKIKKFKMRTKKLMKKSRQREKINARKEV